MKKGMRICGVLFLALGLPCCFSQSDAVFLGTLLLVFGVVAVSQSYEGQADKPRGGQPVVFCGGLFLITVGIVHWGTQATILDMLLGLLLAMISGWKLVRRLPPAPAVGEDPMELRVSKQPLPPAWQMDSRWRNRVRLGLQIQLGVCGAGMLWNLLAYLGHPGDFVNVGLAFAVGNIIPTWLITTAAASQGRWSAFLRWTARGIPFIYLLTHYDAMARPGMLQFHGVSFASALDGLSWIGAWAFFGYSATLAWALREKGARRGFSCLKWLTLGCAVLSVGALFLPPSPPSHQDASQLWRGNNVALAMSLAFECLTIWLTWRLLCGLRRLQPAPS